MKTKKAVRLPSMTDHLPCLDNSATNRSMMLLVGSISRWNVL